MTWNPQVKNAALSNRYDGVDRALRRSSRNVGAGAAAATDSGDPSAVVPPAPVVIRKARISGVAAMMGNNNKPRITAARCHEPLSNSRRATGISTNWPREPTALTMPSSIDRRSGGALRPTAESTTAKLAAPMAIPARKPPDNKIVPGPCAVDIRISASAYNRPPPANTRGAPNRSDSAPAMG